MVVYDTPLSASAAGDDGLCADGKDRKPLPLVISTGDAEENRRLFEEHGIVGRLGARSHPRIVRRGACAQRGDKGVTCLLITGTSLHSGPYQGRSVRRPRASPAHFPHAVHSGLSSRRWILPQRSRISVGSPRSPPRKGAGRGRASVVANHTAHTRPKTEPGRCRHRRAGAPGTQKRGPQPPFPYCVARRA